MRPFETELPESDVLADGLNRKISEIYVPDQNEVNELLKYAVDEHIHETELLALSNIHELNEMKSNYEGSEILVEASYFALKELLEDIVGESDILPRHEGYTVMQVITTLEKHHAFVQMTELNWANVTACLDDGGEVLAYFSDEMWHGFFDEQPLAAEISGMKLVRIRKYDAGMLYVTDYTASDYAAEKQMDISIFSWLAGNGSMLEVYK